MQSGAKKKKACETLEISIRTLQRWVKDEKIKVDQRSTIKREPPKNKLSPLERAVIIETCNQLPFSSLPPSQIVPRLADEGCFLASESSFYRILKENNQLNHRGRSQSAKKKKLPTI